MADCIFCQIVAGKLPAAKVYEDEECLAFLDIRPISPGHTLLVPKTHYETLLDMPEARLSRLVGALPKVAEGVVRGVAADGFNIFQANNPAAGQVIPHVHFHIIPRNSGDEVGLQWRQGSYPKGEMDRIRERILPLI